tara:strand:- start:434 stop:1276 length:843 start_codon:yes stop_codon:yes gene_type:complete
MVKHKPDLKKHFFLSGVVIHILYFLLVVFLIKISGEGFSNPQLLQREYYYFYPELFEELPPSIESELESEIEGSLEHDQNHWLPVTEEDFGIMGTEETETPYLMEELYLVQDDVRDLKTKQEIIRNELGVQEPESTQCTAYSSGVDHPCSTLTTDTGACDASPYCTYTPGTAESCTSTLVADPNTVTPNDTTNCTMTPSSGDVTGRCVDIDSSTATCEYAPISDAACRSNPSVGEEVCPQEYSDNGGLIRGSCPWSCQYRKDRESPKVQGGFLLTDSTSL